MFSLNVKNNKAQYSNVLESSINNKSIHSMSPELMYIKIKNKSKSNSKEAHNHEKETHKIDIIFPNHKKKHYNNKKELIFKKDFKLSLINENSINLTNNCDKKIKMIYEIKKLPNINNKSIIKNIYNKQENRNISKLPKVNLNLKPKKSNKLSKINNIISLNFFTPKLTRIKLKNRNKDRYINLIDLPLKDIEKNKTMERDVIKLPLKEIKTNENIKREIIIKKATKKQHSFDNEKCTIKILKTNKTNELIMSRNIKKDNNNMIYSYYNSPIHSIKSRYNNTRNINDNSCQ